MLRPVAPPAAILVADDETILQRLLTRVLERAGFQVVTAADGDLALAAFEADPGRFAAVVLDATLPPRGGEALLRDLCARRTDLGLVLTSGADLTTSFRALVRECGGVFLAKPFAPEALVEAVRRAADGIRG